MIVCAGALSFLVVERKAGTRPGMGSKYDKVPEVNDYTAEKLMGLSNIA